MSWLRCTPMMWMMIERAAAGSRILRASPLCQGTDLEVHVAKPFWSFNRPSL